MAVALPYIAVAATVASGVMAYAQSQRQARMQEFQAELYTRQAQQQVEARQIQFNQLAVERQAAENKSRDEAVERRKRAFRAQQSMFAAAAARGIVAQPVGSLGAILGDAEEDLFRDLESGRLERDMLMSRYLTEAAGIRAAQAGALTTGRFQAASARMGAQTTRMGGMVSLGRSLTTAYQNWPT